jgi:hypothetical protein
MFPGLIAMVFLSSIFGQQSTKMVKQRNVIQKRQAGTRHPCPVKSKVLKQSLQKALSDCCESGKLELVLSVKLEFE